MKQLETVAAIERDFVCVLEALTPEEYEKNKTLLKRTKTVVALLAKASKVGVLKKS